MTDIIKVGYINLEVVVSIYSHPCSPDFLLGGKGYVIL